MHIYYSLFSYPKLASTLREEEILLNRLYEKLKNKVSLKNVNSNKSCLFKDKQIN